MCINHVPALLEDTKPPEGYSLVTFVGGPINGHRQFVPDDDMYVYTTSIPETSIFDKRDAPKVITYKQDVYRRGWADKNLFYYCEQQH